MRVFSDVFNENSHHSRKYAVLVPYALIEKFIGPVTVKFVIEKEEGKDAMEVGNEDAMEESSQPLLQDW